MNALRSHPSYHQLAAYHFESLEADELRQIDEHLQACAACRNFLKKADRDELVNYFEHPSAPGATKSPAMETLPLPQPEAKPGIPPEFIDHDRYEVTKILGEGGMGMVFRGRQKIMNREVAIKIIHSRHTQSEAAVKRFRQEIESLSRLDHPNIVQAFDAGRIGNLHYFVMEYIEGTDLSKIVQKKGALPVRESCYLMKQVADALTHADEKQMIHRDLKPANLIVTRDGTVKILDFGLARFTREGSTPGLTNEETVMGTPEYMAPEQGRKAKYADIRSDLYSVGVTLYQLLSGRLPFKGAPIECLLAHQSDPVPPLAELRPELPPELVRIVHKLLEKNPEDRYQKPGELARDLAPFAQTKPKPKVPTESVRIAKPKTGTLPMPPSEALEPDVGPKRESIIKGEKAGAIADDADIAFDWAAPSRPKRRLPAKPPGESKPSRTPAPISEPDRGARRGLPSYFEDTNLPQHDPYGDEYRPSREPSQVDLIRQQEKAATRRMILLLLLLAILGGAILFAVLYLLPSRSKVGNRESGIGNREIQTSTALPRPDRSFPIPDSRFPIPDRQESA